ncbi:MAG: class I SAM-dependent methyltransferase [Acidobacteria bacterium]|nr:class I SAM-dependent methyltransferase [Acidobacteriota bacterium]MBW8865952.1 class I SAM-dependent methyltransferase [Acidobacteriota bacterium]
MRTFQLAERFALIIAPFRAFLHNVTESDQLACLRRVHEHLRPGGRFAFNVFHPSLEFMSQHAGALAGVWRCVDRSKETTAAVSCVWRPTDTTRCDDAYIPSTASKNTKRMARFAELFYTGLSSLIYIRRTFAAFWRKLVLDKFRSTAGSTAVRSKKTRTNW